MTVVIRLIWKRKACSPIRRKGIYNISMEKEKLETKYIFFINFLTLRQLFFYWQIRNFLLYNWRTSLPLSIEPYNNSRSKIDGLDRFWTLKTWIFQERRFTEMLTFSCLDYRIITFFFYLRTELDVIWYADRE